MKKKQKASKNGLVFSVVKAKNSEQGTAVFLAQTLASLQLEKWIEQKKDGYLAVISNGKLIGFRKHFKTDQNLQKRKKLPGTTVFYRIRKSSLQKNKVLCVGIPK